MIRNYLTIATRNLVKSKIYSIINVAGLAAGMACCILTLLYVRDEMSYDEHHIHANRIFRLVEEVQVAGNTRRVAITSFPMGPALVKDYPEVIDAVRFFRDDEKTVVGTQSVQFYEDGVWFVDENVFNMFHFPLSKGDIETALKEPHSVVVTEEIAKKYFSEGEPIGQVLSIGGNEFKVTGILKDVDHNTHFQFDFLASGIKRKDWIDHDYYTYLLLRTEDSAKELELKLPEFIERHLGDKIKVAGIRFRPFLQPLTDIHLRSQLEFEMSANGDIRYVYLFLVITAFVLLLACVNFINLSIANSVRRAKEVGIRKAMGAGRFQLICQFLGESTLVALFALVFAVILVELMLPAFNAFIHRELLASDYLRNWDLMLILIGIVVFVGVFSGSYPAFLLSAFQPVDVLKGRLVDGLEKLSLGKSLVVLQSGISVVLIIVTVVVHSQSDYLRNKRLGFDKEHVIVIPVSGKEVAEGYQSRLSEYANVLSISVSSSVPGREISSYLFRPHPDGRQNGTLLMNVIHADHKFIETFGLELLEGQFFSKSLSSDSKAELILNESAMRKLGWVSFAGKELQSVYPEDGGLKIEVVGDVVGLVRDFHYRSLHHEIEPLVIMAGGGWTDYCSIRIAPSDVFGTLAYLKERWLEFAPNVPFEYSFLDDVFDKLHRAEYRLGKMFGLFTLFAIFEASLGLFGLVSFTTNQRIKEIGIRKVLGATVCRIVLQLSKEFALLVGFANLVAWPVAYLGIDIWLQDFAYRVDLSISPFVLGGILSLSIALVTASFHTWKAAQTRPVNVLRYE